MKLAINYGVFSFPAAISLLVMQVYMPSYLASLGILSLTAVGSVFLLARLIDTFTDPVVGYLLDRATGRFRDRRLWILFGLPGFLLSFWMLVDGNYGAVGVFFWGTLWYVCGTVMLVPYYALGAEIDDTYHGHSVFAASRVVFGLAGTVAALTIPVLLWGAPPLEQVIRFNILLAAVVFIVALLLLRNLPGTVPAHSGAVIGFDDVKSLFRRGSAFNVLISSQLVNGTANAFPATVFILFAAHILKMPEMAGPLLVLYFLVAAISVPLWVRLTKYWPKEACWSVGMIVAASVFLLTIFVPTLGLPLFVGITLVTGLMAGADLALPASMLADLVELDAQKRGKRRTGLYFAVWGVTSKLTLALAVGIAFPLLDMEFVGASSDEVQSVNSAMLLGLYAVAPAVLKLVSVILMRGYGRLLSNQIARSGWSGH